MSKRARRLITLIVLAVFFGYFLLNIDKFRPLIHVNAYLLIAVALADLASIAANGLFMRIILRPFGKFIALIESVYVALISSVGNFFAPAGSGFGFRAVYLKKRHGLAYADYTVTLYGNYIIVFLVNAFAALAALYLLRHRHTSEYFVLLVVFASVFGGSLLLSLLKVPPALVEKVLRGQRLNIFAKTLFNILDGWNRIISNKRLMTRLIALTTFNFLLSLLVARLEITALHLSISFPALLLFSVLGSLSLFISITPANLGVKEAIYLFSSSVIGFSTSQILSIALVDRGVLFLVLGLLWLLLSKLRSDSDSRHFVDRPEVIE